jgi:indolepyruvate ferredoxin oxidoreductase alpha subunit
MKKFLLLGDEAIAQGALDAGISGIYAYPGTPSTEIMEYVQRSKQAREGGVHRRWSANEKTAMEAALGMSYAGKRAMVCMKHVGLNVAADAFINSAITGVNGGLVVAVADDPSMHSSQNEQDSRFYGKFAQIPVLEPSNQQEAYDMTMFAFELSEKYGVPVLIRITTRLAHSRNGVVRQEPRQQNELRLPGDPKQFVLLPSIAKKRYNLLLGAQGYFEEEAEKSSFNKFFPGEDKRLGIITTGIAYNYLMENCPDGCAFPVLKLGHYPIPTELIKKIVEDTREILVLEEGYPFVEEYLRGVVDCGLIIHGRLDGTVPRAGELNPNIVARALGKEIVVNYEVPSFISARPPELCPGCGHRDLYLALNEVMKNYPPQRVFSDIGCYTLGALPPFNSINTCVDMGASITMAKGAADAGLLPSVAVIGDSTFTHSGMTGLLDAVNDKTPLTVIILDNYAVAMTGGQEPAGEGHIYNICKGIGVEEEHIRKVIPLPKKHDEMVKVIKEEVEYEGVSVIIAERECIQTLVKKKKMARKKK